MDCSVPGSYLKELGFTGSDIIQADIPATSTQTLPSDYKCGAQLASQYAGKDKTCSGFKNIATSTDCCNLCSTYAACEYWTYGTSGTDAKTCWVKTGSSGNITAASPAQADKDLAKKLVSGYYDPCRDANNTEVGVDYHGNDVVKGITGVTSDVACCHKCLAATGCLYYTRATSGSTKDTCWLKSTSTGKENQAGRNSGTYVKKG